MHGRAAARGPRASAWLPPPSHEYVGAYIFPNWPDLMSSFIFLDLWRARSGKIDLGRPLDDLETGQFSCFPPFSVPPEYTWGLVVSVRSAAASGATLAAARPALRCRAPFEAIPWITDGR